MSRAAAEAALVIQHNYQPGPNDHHVVEKNGRLHVESGLGPDEPTTQQRMAARDSNAARLQQIKDEIRAGTEAMSVREQALEKKELELQRREAKLKAREAALGRGGKASERTTGEPDATDDESGE